MPEAATKVEVSVFQKAPVGKVSEKHTSNRPIIVEGGYAVINHDDEDDRPKKRAGSVDTDEGEEPPVRFSNESVVNDVNSLSTSNQSLLNTHLEQYSGSANNPSILGGENAKRQAEKEKQGGGGGASTNIRLSSGRMGSMNSMNSNRDMVKKMKNNNI